MKLNKVCFVFTIIFLFFVTCFAAEPSLNSTATTLVDSNTGYILHSKNATTKIYPASTTKVLTTIIAIEELDLNKAIVVTKTGIAIPWDSSRSYLEVGEVMTVENLLYCTLLSSGNDAANMLGEAVSGNIDDFVDLMNQKALEIGCTNTHFANAHGYHDNNHYTTAEDMTKIVRYALKNDTFRKICETKTYTVPETNKSNERKLVNTNRLILTKEESRYAFHYEYALGGKTGYTGEAGRCLISWSKKGDLELICCVFGAPSSGSKDKRYVDAINLYDYGFNEFVETKVIDKNDYTFTITDNENLIEYTFGLKDDISIPTNADFNIQTVSYTINMDTSNIIKEVNESQQEVPVSFFVTDTTGVTSELNGTFTLLKKEEISYFDIDNFLTLILILSIVLLVILFLLSKKKHKSKKKYMRKLPSANVSRKARRY